MKLWRGVLLAAAVFAVNAQEDAETRSFAADSKRLMKVVVSHLYHHRDTFLRELTSNAGDAIEKTRLLALTDRSILEAAPELNISIKAIPEENALVIRDTGIGMSREELSKNLGTIARSGTSEFLSKVESESEDASSNLIGQFGLGFYSSFLVAERVHVASKSNSDDTQWVFESSADAESYTIAKDPRGNTLGRGTEITLYLKPDALEYLDPAKLRTLITQHSTYSTMAPIYLWEAEVPELDAKETEPAEESESESDTKQEKEEAKSKWVHLNNQPPIWVRDPKSVSDEEYISFFKATFKEEADPIFWSHFSGEVGSTSFKALVYVPSVIPNDAFSQNYVDLEAVRLYVRRVFITSDLGPTFWPKWLQFAKIIIDADDLPLNVGRDSLQATKALGQIQKNVVKKTLDLFATYAASTASDAQREKYDAFFKVGGTALKLGAHDDPKLRKRIMKLLRFPSSVSNSTSLDDYVSRRRRGQTQIFYSATAGGSVAELEKSPFVERIIGRGYEVFWFLEPLDELLVAGIGEYQGLKFQDVAKKGLKFGDEDEREQQEEERFKEQYKPLIEYLKTELSNSINEVAISTRLTTSPCAVVADQFSWTGNMERLMAAQNNAKGGDDFMTSFFRNAKKVLEINPRHPLIEGLLERVEDGGAEEDTQLRDIVLTLWDTAMVRSGFTLRDTDGYFARVEQLLRKSLGVDGTAKVQVTEEKEAPAVDSEPLFASTTDEEEEGEGEISEREKPPTEWTDWSELKARMSSSQDPPEAQTHDEL